MGKRNTFWKTVSGNYTVVSDAENGNNKMKKYTCNYCLRRYAYNVTRMAAHLFMDCRQCPQKEKDKLRCYKGIDIFKNYCNKGVKRGPTVHKNTRWVHVSKHFRKIFSETTESGNLDTYVCNYCNEQYPCNIKGMVKHIFECNLCPLSVKQTFYNVESNESLASTSQASDTDINEHDDNSLLMETNYFENVNILNQSTSDRSNDHFNIKHKMELNYTDTEEDNITIEENFCPEIVNSVSCNEEHEILGLLAKACYATGISTKIFHNEHWQKVLKTLKPDLKLPSDQLFFQDYLNEEYNCICHKVEEKIQEAKTLGLQIHGLQHKNNNTIIIIFTTPDPVVYKIADAKAARHNPNYLIDTISKVMNENGSNRILSVVTDTVSSWKLLQSKFPITPISYPCNLQILKLLISDIFNLSLFRNILSTCYAIIEEVKNCPTTASVFFGRKDGTELVFPSKKYYEKTKVSLNNLITNKHILQTLVEKGYIRTDNSRNNISDENTFWPSIFLLHNLLKLLDAWVKQMKNGNVCMSLVVQCYHDLNNTFKETFVNLDVSKEQSTEILNCLINYQKYAVQDIHKAASLLNPHCMGKNMSDEDVIDAIAFINKLAKILPEVKLEKIMFDIAAYRTKQGIWAKQFVWDSLNPSEDNKLPSIIWWQSMCASTEISKIAVGILSCSPVLANIGKISNFSDKSNKSERVQKLLYVKHNLNLFDTKENNTEDCYSTDEDSDSSVDSEDELTENNM